MALSLPPNPLFISLTQGGADAFVQGSVNTGLAGLQAYNLRGIAVQITSNITIVNQQNIQIALTRRSKTAMPNITDPDVLAYFDWFTIAATNVGFYPGYSRSIYLPLPQEEVPIVETTIYAQLDSAATAQVNSCILRLDVDVDSMSEVNRLTLVTRSLS